uniref:Rho-GAP domain-containing protein n=1 Tax=Varanus komodoensis TaxID=61221 RepID=A0A8D2LU71_VARKO
MRDLLLKRGGGILSKLLNFSSSPPFVSLMLNLLTFSDNNLGRKVIAFSSCHMPPSYQLNHGRLLEYLKYTLDQYVENDYTIVYFHYGLNSQNKLSLRWLQSIYKEFDRKYFLVKHFLMIFIPVLTFALISFFPLFSHKFGKKVIYLNYLKTCMNQTPILNLFSFTRHDEVLQMKQKKPLTPVKLPPPRPPLPTQLFGVNLQVSPKNNGELIPPVMKHTVAYLKEKGKNGLSSMQSIKEIHKLYNQFNFDAYGDIHIPAVILKTLLRELPQPLLTFETYEQILGITKIVHGLPEQNYAVLKFLICFLHMVSQESIFNKMTGPNLATVFGLNLIWSPEGAPSFNFYPTVFISQTIPGEQLP